MVGGWGSLHGGEFWELQGSSVVLLSGFSEAFVWFLNDSLDNVDGITSGTVSTGHLAVHLGDSIAKGVCSVFLVHVDDIGSSSVLEDDTVVLDGRGLLLEDLADGDDLTLALSDLVLSLHLIPKVGSGKDNILGKDSDSIACWLWGGFTWKLSSDNPKLLDLYLKLINHATKLLDQQS